MQERTIILLSCSRDKRQGGIRFAHNSCRSITSKESLPNLRGWLVQERKEVFDLLHGRDGRLHNEDQMGGFRDLRGSNRNLQLGHDFGEPDSGEEIYLPAYLRYSGRFFTELEKMNRDLSRD